MKIVFDIEANGLHNPTKVHCIVCKDLLTGFRRVWREVTDDPAAAQDFLDFSKNVTCWIGHNVLSYDLPVLYALVNLPHQDVTTIVDTFVVSKLVDYPRPKHSVKDYGIEFNLYKGEVTDFRHLTEEMLEYCIRDVDITHKIYLKYLKYLENPIHKDSILREHKFQLIADKIEAKGFALDTPKAKDLLTKVTKVLEDLDKDILEAFPPRLKLIREVTPKETKYGTISLSSIPKNLRDDISVFSVGSPFSYCTWTAFNPGSPKQVVTILNEAGWQPVEKTDGHVDTEREYNKLKRTRKRSSELDIELQALYTRLLNLRIYGWKISEENLATLPAKANPAARTLATRILYESRRKTLTEMLSLVKDDGRVHGEFHGIGAWTHRMAHRKPNMANVANAVRVSDGKPSPLGKELRQCWRAPKGRLLVGVDAEAIQLRVFAHLINDQKLIDAIVNGDKKLGTDPHSLNKAYFGEYCKTRNAAKHSLYAMFFGGSSSMISTIMGCSRSDAQEAIDALVQKYPGLQRLQKDVFPEDARRGYFIGLDGRKVRIPGATVKDREHLCMSGYLQNGEKVIMSEATIRFEPELKQYDSFLVDLVHDEWQNECPNDVDVCIAVAELECKALEDTGKLFNMNIPITGSYTNDDGKYTFGTNWYQTH